MNKERRSGKDKQEEEKERYSLCDGGGKRVMTLDHSQDLGELSGELGRATGISEHDSLN